METAIGDTEGDFVAASGDSDGWKLGESAFCEESMSCEMGDRAGRL